MYPSSYDNKPRSADIENAPNNSRGGFSLNLNNKTSVLLLVIISSMVFFFLGTYTERTTGNHQMVSEVINKEEGKPEQVDFSLFWEAWKMVDEYHIRADEADAEARVYGAIQGMLNSLNDPYTVFMEAEETEEFSQSIEGRFEGVGMEVGIREEILTVISPLKNSPAEEAGVRSGDKIITVDGKSTEDMSLNQAVSRIRGERGTEVTLEIIRQREDEPLEISIIRSEIDMPILSTEQKDNGIFVIKIHTFTGNVMNKFEQAVKEFQDSNSDKMIIDLRGNAGGLLGASVEVLSHLLPQGSVLLQEDHSGQQGEVYRSKGYGSIDTNEVPIAVLVDRGSASASEILAGALQDHQAATVIGETTFGKGSIQKVENMSGGASLKVTVAEWLTPEGRSFEKEGIEPNIKVERTVEDIDADRDPQMDRAVEYLLQQ